MTRSYDNQRYELETQRETHTDYELEQLYNKLTDREKEQLQTTDVLYSNFIQ